MATTTRRLGTRSRAAVALVAVLAFVWVLGLVSTWADRTITFVTFVAFIAALALLVDWIVASFGPSLWRFTRSVSTSVLRALKGDAEVVALVERHQRLFGWLGRRFSDTRPSGLYLTVMAASTTYFLSGFVSVARSLPLSRALTAYDPRISALLRAFRTPTLTRLLWVATVLADARVLPLLVGLIAVLFVMWGRRGAAALLVVTVAGGALLLAAAESVFRRPRPPIAFALIKEPASFSFPSVNAFTVLVVVGVVVFALWRRCGSLRGRLAYLFLAGSVAVAVGLSRVYLGVHWASDVIASWSLALAWLSVTCGCYLMLVRYRGVREDWAAWSSHRNRAAVTFMVSLAAIVVLVAGAQVDPLLANATAATPARSWTVSVDGVGRPVPTPAELRKLPLYSEKFDGSRQDPVGIVFVGARSQLVSAFAAAGWYVADAPSLTTLTRAAIAAVLNQPYSTGPVTPTFLGATVQDIAFEKPQGAVTVRRRHHVRFWLTDLTLNGAPVWVATASFDSGLEIGSSIPLPTHRIDPNLDAEQAYVANDLVGTGRVALVERARVAPPSTGTNAQGDPWFTQGYVSVLAAIR